MLYLYLLLIYLCWVATVSVASRWSLEGKHVIVTGGTKGIGKEIVQECCELGATVLTCSRNSKELEEFKSIFRRKGYEVHTCCADLSSPRGIAALVATAKSVFPAGSIDCLVNNVGMNIRKPSVEYTAQEYETVMNTNLRSAFSLTMALHPMLKRSGKASVVNLSSVAGGCGVSLQSGVVYAMTKAAMSQMTYNLACEWAPDGIRVNAVSPWYIDTPLARPVLDNTEKLAKILDRTPAKRVGDVREVSAAAAFLCMDAASYITGQNIAVDGAFVRNGNF